MIKIYVRFKEKRSMMKFPASHLNKPIQVGFTVLELSKLLMYEFHYDYMKKKYPEAKLFFTDTDSLCYDIPTEDIYKDMEQDADRHKRLSKGPFPTFHCEQESLVEDEG